MQVRNLVLPSMTKDMFTHGDMVVMDNSAMAIRSVMAILQRYQILRIFLELQLDEGTQRRSMLPEEPGHGVTITMDSWGTEHSMMR